MWAAAVEHVLHAPASAARRAAGHAAAARAYPRPSPSPARAAVGAFAYGADARGGGGWHGAADAHQTYASDRVASSG
jgi:hypothetical protein